MLSTMKDYFFNSLVKAYFIHQVTNMILLIFIATTSIYYLKNGEFQVHAVVFYFTLLVLLAASFIMHYLYLKERDFSLAMFIRMQEEVEGSLPDKNIKVETIVAWEEIRLPKKTKEIMPYFYTFYPCHPLLRKEMMKHTKEKQMELRALRLRVQTENQDIVDIAGWFEVKKAENKEEIIYKQANEVAEAYFGEEYILPVVYLREEDRV